MKPLSAIAALLLAPVIASAQADVPVLRLAGFSTVGRKPSVFIEVTPKARAFHSMPGDFHQLQAGERADQLHVLVIDTATGVVKVRHPSAAPDVAELRLHAEDGQALGAFKPGTLHLENVPLAVHVDVLGRLAGRTVLHGPIGRMAFSLQRENLNPDTARKAVEDGLAKVGFKVQPAGERFVLLLPTNQIVPALPKLEPEPAKSQRKDPKSSGSMKLINAPLEQVLQIYGDLADAQVSRRPEVSAYLPLSMTTQAALTRRECKFALETVLLLNGVRLVRDTDGTVKAEPVR
jgi:hypothetical protein